MATRTIAGVDVQINEEGFLTEPGEWNKEIAAELAKEEGIEALSEDHWKVIEFCRQSATENGSAPTTKELFALYPKGPAKKVARISGLGKPEGCV